MDRMFALSLGFAGLILLMAATAQGQTAPNRCAPRGDVLTLLGETYQETRRGIGLAGPAQVVELFASAVTGSWTVTVTLPDGRTCLLVSGQDWEAVTDKAPAKGNPV